MRRWNIFVRDRDSDSVSVRGRGAEWAEAWQNISIACSHFINAAHSLIEAVVNLWWWCLLLLLLFLLLLLLFPTFFPVPSLSTLLLHDRKTQPPPSSSKWVFVYSECWPRRTTKWTTNMAPDGPTGSWTGKTQCEIMKRNPKRQQQQGREGWGMRRRGRNWQGANYMYNQVKKYESTLINRIH